MYHNCKIHECDARFNTCGCNMSDIDMSGNPMYELLEGIEPRFHNNRVFSLLIEPVLDEEDYPTRGLKRLVRRFRKKTLSAIAEVYHRMWTAVHTAPVMMTTHDAVCVLRTGLSAFVELDNHTNDTCVFLRHTYVGLKNHLSLNPNSVLTRFAFDRLFVWTDAPFMFGPDLFYYHFVCYFFYYFRPSNITDEVIELLRDDEVDALHSALVFLEYNPVLYEELAIMPYTIEVEDPEYDPSDTDMPMYETMYCQSDPRPVAAEFLRVHRAVHARAHARHIAHETKYALVLQELSVLPPFETDNVRFCGGTAYREAKERFELLVQA